MAFVLAAAAFGVPIKLESLAVLVTASGVFFATFASAAMRACETSRAAAVMAAVCHAVGVAVPCWGVLLFSRALGRGCLGGRWTEGPRRGLWGESKVRL